jgi:hypothetical protein
MALITFWGIGMPVMADCTGTATQQASSSLHVSNPTNSRISPEPKWPELPFRTTGAGVYTWNWTIQWRDFERTGTATTKYNEWRAVNEILDAGGRFAVSIANRNINTSGCVIITGSNPAEANIRDFINTNPGSEGFNSILAAESGMRHFTDSGEPIVSRDNGYGIAQLTDPRPTFEEVWNWKANIKAALSLYSQKRDDAKRYLSQQSRVYTQTQLMIETVSRWNGGKYHVWDETAEEWKRDPAVLCDKQTGNIGWDLNDPANSALTATDLHQRDSAEYNHRLRGQHWRHYGVCYADTLFKI